MGKAQYGIMRFAKYKGPEIGNIEAHNERTKEKYASNPDVDTSRSKQNFHLIQPKRKYRAEAESQIAAAGCRTRKDSVRVVEALFTASPEFFQGKKRSEIKEYFQEALTFLEKYQSKETIISAVVHMDEKTPHMHLSFVPLTEDGRLSAKEILGNKKKLTWWQDEFWKHMVKEYPDLERGESASETGRDHIPPRVFKEMTQLNKQKEKLEQLLTGINAFNAKGRAAEIGKLLDSYIPNVEKIKAQQSRAYAQKVKISNLQQMAKTVAYIQENGFDTRENLQTTYDSITLQMHDARQKTKDTETQIKSVNEQIHYLGQYLSTKSTYNEFLKARFKGKFRKDHADEIEKHEKAVQILKAQNPDGSLPKMKDLKLEKERLLALKAAQYDTYTYYKDYQKELRTACANVDNILGQHHIRDHTQRTEQTL